MRQLKHTIKTQSVQQHLVGDEHAALAVMINRAANKIAQRTRRGAGNFAVVSVPSVNSTSNVTGSRSQEQLKVRSKHQLILN